MSNKFYIAGAGGFAREIYSYLADLDFKLSGFKLAGFLDDNPNALEHFYLNHNVELPLFSDSLPICSAIVMAVAEPNLKERVFNFYKDKGFDFLIFIHKSAFIGQRVKVGEGTVVAPNCVITSDVTIGKCVTINAMASVGHDAVVGSFSTLSGHCDVTGFVQLGEKVFMGSHALIIPSVKVGDDSVIGAGSVVISKVKPGYTVFGNPAKKIN